MRISPPRRTLVSRNTGDAVGLLITSPLTRNFDSGGPLRALVRWPAAPRRRQTALAASGSARLCEPPNRNRDRRPRGLGRAGGAAVDSAAFPLALARRHAAPPSNALSAPGGARGLAPRTEAAKCRHASRFRRSPSRSRDGTPRLADVKRARGAARRPWRGGQTDPAPDGPARLLDASAPGSAAFRQRDGRGWAIPLEFAEHSRCRGHPITSCVFSLC